MNIPVKNGFAQLPSFKVIEGKTYNLEQELRHSATGNVFKIKEIQDRGFIVYLVLQLGQRITNQSKIYLSNKDLHEYE